MLSTVRKHMKVFMRAAVIALAVVCFMVGAAPRPAQAHPMGNFTINRYSALTVGADRVDILYVVDMAEIPAYQELGTIRSDHSTDLTPQEREAYTSKKSAQWVEGLSLVLDGKSLLLQVEDTILTFPPGAGGLPTLRVELNLSAQLGGVRRGSLGYQDNNYKERIGWKEIIAKPEGGVTFESSSVPANDLSEALSNYQSNLLNNPPDVTSASLVFTAIGAAASAGSAEESARAQVAQQDTWGSLAWVQEQTNAITQLMKQKDLPLGALVAALMIAFGIGAAHALSPGHGKTIVAAYLVGSRGKGLHAILLGLIVTISHTFGVFLLGGVVLYLADYILPETLYPWLSFLSGSLLVAMGLTLFVQRWRAWRGQNVRYMPSHGEHGHSHGGHEHSHEHHDHEHSHSDATEPHTHGPFGRPHTHVPADGQKVTPWNLLVLGITGGIIPCPSALVVLLVAIASGQVGLGLLLILAFSMGLAVVLMGIGLILVYSRSLLQRFKFGGARLAGLFGRLPMLSALAVSVLGVFIALGAFKIR